MMRPRSLFFLLASGLANSALAADRTEQVAGWTLSDKGGKPGNDLDREVSMIRKAPGVEINYGPGPGPGRSGAVTVKFAGCESRSEFTASLNFKSSADAVKSVRDEIAYDFAEFRKTCPVTAEAEKAAMEGFDKAFETVTQWVKDKPFVYPPSEAPVAPAGRGEPVPVDTI